MMKNRDAFKLPELTYRKVNLKINEIQEMEKFQYNPEQVEQMVDLKLQKRLREGNLKGLNLAYLKVELQSNLESVKGKLAGESNPKQ